jgi:hypothetical protein
MDMIVAKFSINQYERPLKKEKLFKDKNVIWKFSVGDFNG